MSDINVDKMSVQELIDKYGGKDDFHATGPQTTTTHDVAVELSMIRDELKARYDLDGFVLSNIRDELNELVTFKREMQEWFEQIKPFLQQIQENPMGFFMTMLGGK